MNRLITSSETEFVIKKNLPASKSPVLDSFTGEFCQIYKEKLIPILLKLFQKFIVQDYHYPDTKTKRENYRPISLMTIDAKILNKILANQIQKNIKRIIHHDQVEIIWGMQEWFDICKSINVLIGLIN